MRDQRSQFRGFTLIELILVLSIMAILVAMAAPSMRGWSKGAKMRDATDQLLSASRFARTAAINSASVHRLEINDSGLTFRVMREDGDLGADVPADGEFAQEVTVNEHLHLRIVRDDGVIGPILFFPDGRVTPATIRVEADWGDVVEVVAPTPASTFRVLGAALGGMG